MPTSAVAPTQQFNITLIKHTDTDLWFSGLTSNFGHCVCVTTEAMYLRLCPHVPHLFAIQTNYYMLVKQ